MAEPPEKKTKLSESLENYIADLMNSKKNLVPILDDMYTKPVPTIPVYAGRVKDMKQCSKIIEICNKKYPMNGLTHLKRVSRNCVLIRTVDDFGESAFATIQDCLNGIPELKDAFEYIKEVDVPAVAPLTKHQNSICRFKWATNFHPSPQYEALFSEAVFPPNDLKIHRTYMAMAFEMARIHLKLSNPKVEDVFSWAVTTAVVVDPTINSVVALGLCNRRNNPTQHASMVAIDNVAKTQNGGVWFDEEQCSKIEDIKEKLKVKFSSIKFGARNYVSKKEDTDMALVEKSPYLCTGYDIYLIKEPCVMCAMGLVHARVKRVFYTNANERLGALNSKTKLHCVKHLNHKFQVFTGF